jgi:uncharacterized protein (TIGR04255 family)
MAVSPFGAEPVTEVPLARAPLVNVLSQVRYPKVPLFITEEGAAAVHERLRERYPILRRAPAVTLTLTPTGMVQQLSQNSLWRLQTRDGTWTITLSDEFLSIETRAYRSRDDFHSHLEEALAAVTDVGEPVIYDRVGVRYINQLTGEAADRVRELVRPELHGLLTVPLPERANLSLALSEALFRFADFSQLRARWGSLPENAAVDPTVPPVPTRSWILDLDSFTEAAGDFRPSVLGELTRHLADQAYQFFRWTITPAFDEFFGGAG